jgi:hypothetical protein
MASNIGKEAQMRDHMAEQVGSLPDLVTNLAAVRASLEATNKAFIAIPPDQGGPTATDLRILRL